MNEISDKDVRFALNEILAKASFDVGVWRNEVIKIHQAAKVYDYESSETEEFINFNRFEMNGGTIVILKLAHHDGSFFSITLSKLSISLRWSGEKYLRWEKYKSSRSGKKKTGKRRPSWKKFITKCVKSTLKERSEKSLLFVMES